MPIESTATANPVLTVLAVQFMAGQQAFVAPRLFPLFPTPEQSARYYVFDKENLLNFPTNLQRAPGGNYARSRMKLSDDSFICREFGHEEPVDDRERKKYQNYFNADQAAIRRGTNIMLANWEIRVRDKAISASVPTSTPATKWNAANSTPIEDIDTARTSVQNKTGLEANLIVMSRDVFNVLKIHTEITDKIKYTQRGIATPDLLASLFNVDTVLVAGGVEGSAAEGQAVTAAQIWSDNVIVAHVENASDLSSPNFGRTFAWTGETGPDGVLVETYRDDEIRSDIHRVRQDMDEKLVGADAGYNLSNVLA